MAKIELSYDQATAQIEAIMTKLRSGTMSIDELAVEVKKATELIAHCKERLRTAESELKKVME